ncbi:MAG: leucine-rich repeat domain-containing protein, partial [Chloroflexi bacterium]|nr:leucine-rich repeat domain-containing protein [Chloroflexota bacterium]
QLDFNNISDLSPLAGLTNLNYINLIGNQINDLSPLVHNMGLRNVFLSGNPLNDEAIRVYLPQLEQRGVIVR